MLMEREQDSATLGGLATGAVPMGSESSPPAYAGMAGELSSYGRNGDTTMMHVNPAEIDGLEKLLGRSLSINPDTGMREGFAWLPLVMGALGALKGGVGGAVGGAMGAGGGGGFLGGLMGMMGGNKNQDQGK